MTILRRLRQQTEEPKVLNKGRSLHECTYLQGRIVLLEALDYFVSGAIACQRSTGDLGKRIEDVRADPPNILFV
jgi:hypothetical protein